MPRDHPPPLFISAVGNDSTGESLLSNLKHLDTRGVLISSDESTASYTGIIDKKGECLMGIGDMAAHMLITAEHVQKFQSTLENCPIFVIDGNIPQDTMDYILRVAKQNGIPVWFEPTDAKKAYKAFISGHVIDFASPNLNELRTLMENQGASQSQLTPREDPPSAILKEAFELSHMAMSIVNTLFVTLGKLGVMVTSKGSINDPLIKCCSTKCATTRLYPPPIVSTFVSVSGAGDCFAAGVGAGMLKNLPESECVAAGTAAAAMSIAAHSTVPSELNAESIPWGSTAKYQIIPNNF
ncbi:uncharacterized protein [Hetaerina americana]|uniref:uncharacterized protein n=1 Tax=Hetaerina americana TaxID=62018 RepID=UPI003A7F5EB2